MPHRNTLKFHRKKWALSQADIAHLVGIKARSVISVYEAGAKLPQLRAILAYQFVFGASLEMLFPNLAKEVEEQVMRRAAALDAKVRHRTDATAIAVRQLLQDLISRAGHADPA